MTTTTLGLREFTGVSDRRREAVQAAARAAADWARTRRAVWAPEPLVISQSAVPAAPVPAAATVTGEPQPAHVLPSVPADPPPIAIASLELHEALPDFTANPSVEDPVGELERPAFGARALAVARIIRGEGRRRLAMAAVFLIVLTAGVTARAYWFKAATVGIEAANRWVAPKPAAAESNRPAAAQGAPVARGRLEVTSDPPGARVTIDGADRGVTPLTLEDVAPGSHAVVLATDTGSVRRAVRVTANETARIAEMIVSGWVSVLAPFDIVVSDGSAVVQPDDRGQIMLAPGPHALHFQNRELGFDEVRRVTVRPGETQAISLSAPQSTLTVTASEPADVFIDGAPAGPTPMARPVDLGTHEVVVKAASGGEQRIMVIATVKPVDVEAQFGPR